MTKEQLQALSQLRKAFTRCRKADLVFTGVDNSIMCADANNENFIELMDKMSPCEAMIELHNIYGEIAFIHGSEYLDSGAT